MADREVNGGTNEEDADLPRPFHRGAMFIGSRWWLEVHGDREALRAMAEMFTAPGLRVVADDQGEYWLGSDELNSLSQPDDAAVARARLEQFVVIASGTLRLLDPDFFGLVHAGQALKFPGGTNLGHVVMRRWLTRDDRKRLGMPPPSANSGTKVREWSDLARKDTDAHELLRRIGVGSLSWDDLYRAFEVLRDLAGGEQEIARRGWASKQDLERFAASANHPVLGGELARHARRPGSAPGPRLQMELDEARWLIAGIAKDWLASRGDDAPAQAT